MATSYPGSLDTFTNPTSSDNLDSPDHAAQHSDVNDAVEAVEAKVGTGTSTPTEGKVLTGSATAGESEWGDLPASAPVRRVLASGFYYVPGVDDQTAQRGNGDLICVPFHVDQDVTLDRIGVEVTTAGSTGALIRLGIYGDTGGLPGSLLVDAGTVDATTAGFKEITISEAITAGRIWLAACIQGAPSTIPFTRCIGSEKSLVDVGNPSGGTLIQFPLNGYKETGVTGALPATFTRSGGEPVSHRIAVRAA